MKLVSFLLSIFLASNAQGWSPAARNALPLSTPTNKIRFASRHLCSLHATAAATTSSDGDLPETAALSPAEEQKRKLKQQIRKEGGLFAFNTKYGALNPFAIYYGLTAILLGIPWFFALTFCQILYTITGGRVDKLRRLPVFFTQIWGVSLMYLTGCVPKIVNHDILLDFYKQKRAAMFVANHNSWMDIPFVGCTIGWRNYKLISKAELGRVPILGKAIREGKNIMVDRSNRKSQLMTLKSGIQMLKDGVHLCTFPEGTRSRTGRMLPFKNGAFKMAHKIGAPIVPFSIVASGSCMPAHWMFPRRPATGLCEVVIHEPIESEGKTEQELAAVVREAVISGLPPEQRPLEK